MAEWYLIDVSVIPGPPQPDTIRADTMPAIASEPSSIECIHHSHLFFSLMCTSTELSRPAMTKLSLDYIALTY